MKKQMSEIPESDRPREKPQEKGLRGGPQKSLAGQETEWQD